MVNENLKPGVPDKRPLVESAADLLELAGDVAEEIKRRSAARDEESWINPDDLDLQSRVLIAQVLAATSLRQAADNEAVQSARRKLAEIQERITKTQDGPWGPPRSHQSPGVIKTYPFGADAQRQARVHMVPAPSPQPPVLFVYGGTGNQGESGGFRVEYVGPFSATIDSVSPPTMTVRGDAARVLKAIGEMLTMFTEATTGQGGKA